MYNSSCYETKLITRTSHDFPVSQHTEGNNTLHDTLLHFTISLVTKLKSKSPVCFPLK